MSYDISLVNKKEEPFGLDEPLPEEQSGGTYPLGGRTKTELNITYNYSWYYYKFLDKEKEIRWLYGKKAKDCVKRLEKAIEPFKNSKRLCKDYWCKNPVNCVAPLRILLAWAKQFPRGVFRGD